MNQLVIIGNGFDLAHGLKTSYSHFILWYLNEIYKYERERREFDENIDLAWIHYQYYSSKRYETIEDYFDYINHAGINIVYNKFFKKISKGLKELNWVDIEKLYFEELTSIIKDIRLLDSHSISTFTIKEVERLNKSLNLIKVYLEKYLINIDNDNLDFRRDIIEKFQNIASTDGSKASMDKVYILTFNYTHTIEKYINKNKIQINKKNLHINHIHGMINAPDNPMIFGYGDETDSIFSKIEDLDENELTKCMKSFHYVLNGNYRHLFDFLDSDNFNVYIMGHSCGLSDRVMFNKILQHPNMNEIKIFYHKKGNASHENDFFEKVQNISRYFDSNSKHLMRTKITPLSMSLPLTDL